MYEWIGLVVVCGLVAVGVAALTPQTWSPAARRIVALGAVARVAGALLRYEVIARAYGGQADAKRYYQFGDLVRSAVWSGDFETARVLMGERPSWWGTSFLENMAGVVVTVVGPTERGTFVVFSMIGYVGVVLLVLAATRSFPGQSVKPAVTAMLFWPSMWFWPSSLGKESIILLGFGLVVSGYAGGPGVRWGRLIAGLAVSFLIRPHVAAVVVVGLAAAELLGSEANTTARRLGRTVGLGAAAALVVAMAASQLGVDDLSDAEEFLGRRGANTETGGSRIERPTGVFAVPMALINVLARPFPWEARNPMSFVSALEMVVLWVYAFRNRARLRQGARLLRSHRLVRLSLVLALGLALAYGLNYGNLGIIARQRVVIFPFLFILLGAPMVGGIHRRLSSGVRRTPRVVGGLN